MPAKKFYITTSIPYTNAPPHIGFAFEAVQADVLARFHRALAEDVFFLTGTDEHGLKTLRAAEAAGKEVLEFADEVSGKFRDLAKVLNISNDDFIRTTDKERHLPAVYALWEKFKEKENAIEEIRRILAESFAVKYSNGRLLYLLKSAFPMSKLECMNILGF